MPTEAAPFNVNPSQDSSVTGWMSQLGELPKDETTPAPTSTEAVSQDAPVSETDNQAGVGHTSGQPVAVPDKPKEPTTPAKPSEEPEERWPRTADEWKKFKAARKEREAQLTTEKETVAKELASVRAEIETLRKSGPSPELDQLKKERDELSERLRVVDVQQHPKFKAYFENKINAQIGLAKSIVGPDKASHIEALLKLPDSTYKDQQMEALISDLPVFAQSRLGSVQNALSELENERQGEIAKAKETYTQIESQRTESAKAERAKLEKNFDDMVKDAQAKHPLFQNRAGDENWNKDVETRLEQARTLLFGNPGAEVTMKAALAATAFQPLLQGYQAMQAENQKLQAQIKELTAAQPKVDTNGSPKTGTEGTVAIKNRNPGGDPMQAAADFMKVLQAPME